MSENDVIQQRIEELNKKHRAMDEQIASGKLNMLELQRLKREKLALKDAIARLQTELYSDITA